MSRESTHIGFALAADEPFAAPGGYGLLGIREAYARGLVTKDVAERHYPGWDMTILATEAENAKMDRIGLDGEIEYPGVDDALDRVAVE